jgi:nitrite reductase/ring-hydroxylating ferredoxin subunit/Fe-S cluster biogenesis protein NfuA
MLDAMHDAGTSATDVPPELDRLLGDLHALEALAAGWEEPARTGAAALMSAIDALNAEAFRRLIRSLKARPGAATALAEAARDEVVYAVLRRHGLLKPSLHERVEAALETVRPMLASHGGNAEIAAIEGSRADIRFLGACDGCPASQLTFYAGVKKAITDLVPEITEVRQVKGLGGGGAGTVHFTSPFAETLGGEWRDAADLGELPDGSVRFRSIGDEAVILARQGDSVTCFRNACAHMGLELTEGEVEDGILTCPWHGFRYALDSGECLTAPEVALHAHAVRVIGNRVQVRLVP